ncbi:helix-turn-helix domain-containing protein [Amycolatopsis anabasis]|uniref:helix-turn-helix domain-containing protein n=1 Tax=Amycolatopsis anabasis TaxID=1840409 RepID=UPI00131E83EB
MTARKANSTPARNAAADRRQPVRLLSPRELADYLGITLNTLYVWNTRGQGPRRYRVGRHVRYRLADVDAWLEKQVDGGGHAA